MSWSCSSEAGDVLHEVWTKQCHTQTQSPNSYHGTDGYNYFYELTRSGHDDGRITGTTWRESPDGEHVTRAGSWRINADGSVARYPTAWPFPMRQHRQGTASRDNAQQAANWLNSIIDLADDALTYPPEDGDYTAWLDSIRSHATRLHNELSSDGYLTTDEASPMA